MPASGRGSERVSGSAGALRGLLRALCGAAALAAPGAAPAAEFADPHGVAVVIGNRIYTHERVPDVDYAHRDADAFYRYVVDVLGFAPENVYDLRDASKGEMETAFGNERDHKGLLWRYLDSGGRSDVVVFYSGHGVPGLEDGRGYLLPADADPNTAHINGYAIDTLYANLAKLEEARSVRVFLDACFSGGSAGGQLVTGFSGAPTRATLRPDPASRMTALTAATGSQVASWDEDARHGLFTHHLLDALYGAGDANGDGRVTAAEAKTYLDRHMTRAARRTFGRIQNADLGGDAAAVLSSASPGGEFPKRVSGDPSAAEQALELSREDWTAAQLGLEAAGFDPGPADGEANPRTREAISSWQNAEGYEATSYLTADQADALVAEGREVLERDAAAFASARRADTAAAYEEYLSSFPSGLHAADARRLRDAAAGREALAVAREQAERDGSIIESY